LFNEEDTMKQVVICLVSVEHPKGHT
jgi:hypothetical protein